MPPSPLGPPALPFFGKGRFRFVVLRTLEERPMHGYEVLKALEARFQGFYRPSAGAIYPALRSLEREGLVAATRDGPRNVWRITAKGRAHLRRQQAAWERRFKSFEAAVGPDRARLMRELRETGKLLGANLRDISPAQARALRRTLERTRKEVLKVLAK